MSCTCSHLAGVPATAAQLDALMALLESPSGFCANASYLADRKVLFRLTADPTTLGLAGESSTGAQLDMLQQVLFHFSALFNLSLP